MGHVCVVGFRLVNTKCMMLVDMWKKIQHSNAVTLREVFTTKAFGDHCEFVRGGCLCVHTLIFFVCLSDLVLFCTTLYFTVGYALMCP